MFLDMFAITFGVLLALALTEWREKVENQAFVENSLNQVEAEIIRNFEKINAAYEYRESSILICSKSRAVKCSPPKSLSAGHKAQD